MKDREDYERSIIALIEVRNHLANDTKWSEHVEEIDDLICNIREVLEKPSFLQDPQLRADLIRLGELAIVILSVFAKIFGV